MILIENTWWRRPVPILFDGRTHYAWRPYRPVEGVALVWRRPLLLLALALTLLVPHDQRRLHMPEPWSYALAAQDFAQGKWTLSNDELAAARYRGFDSP